jgi:hypothetical protein
VRTATFAVATILLAASAPARAAQVHAAPASGPIAVDGKLDDAAWAEAEPFTEFQQVFPGEGIPPSEQTEVRVLFGEKTLYVGIRCKDATPDAIVGRFGRRDHPPLSDSVTLYVDAAHEGRSALLFALTAGGVQSDALVFDDDQISYDWDGAWEGAAQVDAEGWTAELAIPLSLIRFTRSEGAWGFGVVREVARTHEKMASFPLPRASSGVVARLGGLEGLAALTPQAGLEVAPYVAQRVTVRPQFSDPSNPRPRLADPTTDLGLDLRAGLGRTTFSATLNPDFGQVEADEIILNTTTFEPFFPEKRPFFTEGADAFQSVGAGREKVPQQVFYSRRIGLEAPILGAAKVVGQPADRLHIGVVEALVMGAAQPEGASEESPDRRLAWSAARPLHFGPGDASPLVKPVTQNFFAGTARLRLSDGLTVGAQAASAMPLAGPCSPADDAADARTRPSSCDAQGGDALALDFNAASSDGAWYAYGQAAGSRIEGGPPERTLRDGTVLLRDDMGAGGYLRAGKRGGGPLRFDLAWTYASPRLDLNPAGFQRTQNEQEAKATVKLVGTGVGPFHELTLRSTGYSRWTTDGRGLSRGVGVNLGTDALLRDPYLLASCRVAYDDPRYDVREIAFTGVPLRRSPTTALACDFTTDEARSVSSAFGGYLGKNLPQAGLGAPMFHGLYAGATFRPHRRLETKVEASYDHFAYPARFVGEVGGGDVFEFGEQHAQGFSFTLRQLLVLTSRLSLQLYGQVFTALESYGPFYQAVRRGQAPIEVGALRPLGAPASDPSDHSAALVVNAVLRWEYRLGSTLHLVYARNQAELPFTARPSSLAPHALGLGPTTDSFLLKWSYRFAG